MKELRKERISNKRILHSGAVKEKESKEDRNEGIKERKIKQQEDITFWSCKGRKKVRRKGMKELRKERLSNKRIIFWSWKGRKKVRRKGTKEGKTE